MSNDPPAGSPAAEKWGFPTAGSLWPALQHHSISIACHKQETVNIHRAWFMPKQQAASSERATVAAAIVKHSLKDD